MPESLLYYASDILPLGWVYIYPSSTHVKLHATAIGVQALRLHKLFPRWNRICTCHALQEHIVLVHTYTLMTMSRMFFIFKQTGLNFTFIFFSEKYVELLHSLQKEVVALQDLMLSHTKRWRCNPSETFRCVF